MDMILEEALREVGVPATVDVEVDLGTAQPGEYLCFRLDGQDYGIDILRVQEIRGWEAPTRIAGGPPALCGVLDLRGTVVPVIDLRRLFGLPAGFDGLTVTVVLGVGGRTVGAVADAVADVVALQDEHIGPAPALQAQGMARHINGLGMVSQGDRDRLLILLDIQGLMAECLLASPAAAAG